MRLDRLQLDLHPRSHWQAIDLGMSLLRQSAMTVYAAWLCLWLPTVLVFSSLASWLGEGWYWLFIVPWWVRPLLERVIVLVLSRAVFGERLSWRQALREWPRQLGGGWFRLLTWWRPFMAGRGLFQAVWQLEGARGKFANARRAVLARDGAGAAAYWFGIACAHFELVLQVGALASIGIFMSPPDAVNPFLLLSGEHLSDSGARVFVAFSLYGISMAVIAPIYSAGCFTLYLIRRAQLEAWDIELVFKQLPKRQPAAKTASRASLVLVAVMGAWLVTHALPVLADGCEPPKEPWYQVGGKKRDAAVSPGQTKVRAELEKIYQSPGLRGYECEKGWHLKPSTPDLPKPKAPPLRLPLWLGDLIKLIAILGGVALAAWLLYRYRDQIAAAMPGRRLPPIPDAVGGFDIRPESLPDDVVQAVLALWRAGQHRASVALLYRATLSRLVHRHAVVLGVGATEGDWLRAAERAQYQGSLAGGIYATAEQVTNLWLKLAYAHGLVRSDDLEAVCASWQTSFGEVAP